MDSTLKVMEFIRICKEGAQQIQFMLAKGTPVQEHTLLGVGQRPKGETSDRCVPWDGQVLLRACAKEPAREVGCVGRKILTIAVQ